MADVRKAGTLAEIARECGVAISTVSYVLRGKHREARISQARAEQILETARRLDYRPNAAAVAMRRGRFNAIALAISEVIDRQSVFPDLLNGLLQATRSRDLHLVMGMLSDEQFDARGPLPRILREWAVDGLLINYIQDFPAELEQAMEEQRLPTVWVNLKRAGDCVYPADEEAAFDATSKLIAQGHRRVAYLTGNWSGHYSHPDRRRGYERAMDAAGLKPQVPHWGRLVPRAERAALVRTVLAAEDRPTAALTYEGDDAIAVLTAAQGLGLQIPRDLSLIGIHDRPLDFSGRDLSTWVIPAAALASRAVALLAAKIDQPDRIQPPSAIPFTAHAGDSVAPPP